MWRSSMIVSAMAGCLLLAGLHAGAMGQDKVADKGIRGTWSGTLQGFDLDAKVVFGAEDVTLEVGTKKKKEVVKGTYKTSSDKNPKALDLMVSKVEGDKESVKKLLAIYVIEGDVLKICWDASDRGRPESFDLKSGKGDPRLLHLKREKQ